MVLEVSSMLPCSSCMPNQAKANRKAGSGKISGMNPSGTNERTRAHG